MAPLKENSEEIIEFNLDTLKSVISSKGSQIDDKINVVNLEQQKRITIYHYVVHILAFLIILPYIVLIIFNYEIPDSYSTIVSIVIGFYFAKSLFKAEPY